MGFLCAAPSRDLLSGKMTPDFLKAWVSCAWRPPGLFFWETCVFLKALVSCARHPPGLIFWRTNDFLKHGFPVRGAFQGFTFRKNDIRFSKSMGFLRAVPFGFNFPGKESLFYQSMGFLCAVPSGFNFQKKRVLFYKSMGFLCCPAAVTHRGEGPPPSERRDPCWMLSLIGEEGLLHMTYSPICLSYGGGVGAP